MALDAGVMSVTVEFAKDLKDMDFFGKQDPYCTVRVGGQTFRTRTAKDGGRNPVWNETFRFNVVNENDMEVVIKDDDIGKDDHIGSAIISLARARQAGTDRIQAPVILKKKHKQQGFISVSLSWAPNKSLAHPPPHSAHAPVAYGAAPFPGYMASPPQYLPPQYAAAPYGPPAPVPLGYYPPPAGQYYPPAAPPAQYPPGPYHPTPGPNKYPPVH